MLVNDAGGVRRSNIRGGIRSQADSTVSLDPLTINFQARVAGVGGTLNAAEIAAVDKYAKGIRADGIVTAGFILRENLCIGDFTALPVPFINTVGAAVDTITFTAPSYDRTLGLQGNLTGKVKTGCVANTLPANAAGLSVYARDSSFGANQNGHGAIDASNNYFAFLTPYVDQQLYSILYGLDGSFFTGVCAQPWGHLVAQRTTATRNIGYQNGAPLGAANVNPTLAAPAVEIAFFAINDVSGTSASLCANLLAEWGIIGAATDALILAWSARLQTFQNDLGRKVP